MPRSKGPVNPAPHGRDENGVPLAPYGLNIDGTPRKSNRGRPSATPGTRPAASSVKGNLTDLQRKSMLGDLLDALIIGPLARASQTPALANRIGRHADALAGDAFILSQYAPGIFDGLILLSKTKPQTLAWMDKAESNAPYVLLAQVGFQMAQAMVANHMRPNPSLAEAGRNLAALRLAQMAEAVNAEAERIKRSSAAYIQPETPVAEPQFSDDPTVQFAA